MSFLSFWFKPKPRPVTVKPKPAPAPPKPEAPMDLGIGLSITTPQRADSFIPLALDNPTVFQEGFVGVQMGGRTFYQARDQDPEKTYSIQRAAGDHFRFEVQQNDQAQNDAADRSRAELVEWGTTWARGDRHHIRVIVKRLTEVTDEARWAGILQLHGANGQGAYNLPQFVMSLYPGRFQFEYRYGATSPGTWAMLDPLYVTPGSTYTVDLDWITDATNGLLEVKVGGVLHDTYSGPLGFADEPLGPRLQTGIYAKNDVEPIAVEVEYVLG